jgi:predicted secreted acid phosphatase
MAAISRRLRTAARGARPRNIVFAIVTICLSMTTGAAVIAATAQPAIRTTTPHSEDQITNLDVLRQQIRNYYGDPLGTGTFSADSFYAREAGSVASKGGNYLDSRVHGKAKGQGDGVKAILLDVDDTTLATWNYEIFSNWAFNPTTNATFVTGEKFPAVPGMVDMVSHAAAKGYAIFYLTGRPASQEGATLANLTTADVAGGVSNNYPAPTTLNNGEDGLFTKPAVADYPAYLQTACADEISQGKSCTRLHYKSATRAHIESLGYDIVANFGDQFSDLQGGFADRTFKLPNPNYFLP